MGHSRTVTLVLAALALGASGVALTAAPVSSQPDTSPETFTFTGANQTFTVPAGVTTITVEVFGAQGRARRLLLGIRRLFERSGRGGRQRRPPDRQPERHPR